jgi:chromate transporter
MAATASRMSEAGSDADPPTEPRAVRLRQLVWLFLKLGTIAFGGPAAHIAMMEDEVVRRRKWMTREKFLDLLGATNLIPGPNSTEMAIHIGYLRAGSSGLLVAGTCFILPAALIVSGIAWAYVRFGTLPQALAVLYGIKPVIIAVVVQALWGLGKTAVKTRFLGFVAVGALGASLLGVNELAVLFAGGIVVALWRWGIERRHGGVSAFMPLLGTAAATAPATAGVTFGLWPLFLVFLKIGSVLFGSGYVLLAFLRADLVERLGWLTEAQLLDAVAVGQMTPGPVFTTATFIGYVLGGGSGALVATVGIFLPAFVFVALSGPLVPRIRRSKAAGAVLDGVNVASLSLMAAVTISLARAAIVDVPTAVLALLAAVLLLLLRINSAWLVLAGGAVGIASAYVLGQAAS